MLIVFSLSRVSESFILLRAHEVGMGTVTVLLLWAMLCAIQSGVAWAGSGLSDRFDKMSVVALTWVAYGVGLIFISAVNSPGGVWIAAAAYASLTGMGEGAEKSLVSELATDAARGAAFGWYSMIVGLAAIPAGLLFGAVWSQTTAGIAFAAFGGLAIVSAALVGLLHYRTRPEIEAR